MNYLEAVMDAVSRSVQVGSNQQLTDTNTTLFDINLEDHIYNEWTSKVTNAANSVTTWANKLAKDPNNKSYQNHLTAAQANLQKIQTAKDTLTKQASSGAEAMDSQAGQDSSNMQQKVQLEAAINQVLQTLSSALGH